MAADELTKTLLLEEAAAPRAIAEALFISVTGRVPLIQALVDAGAATSETLARYLARTEAPFLRHVIPLPELVERLPRGLCSRLLALPVRHDAITGTVDIVVADPSDPHPPIEMSFHLGAPVRVVRAPLEAIEEALRGVRMATREEAPSALDRFNAAARAAADDPPYDERSRGLRSQPPSLFPRPRSLSAPMSMSATASMSANASTTHGPRAFRRPATLPPSEPALSHAVPSQGDVPPRRGGLVIDTDSAPPPPEAPPRIKTPAWGTPVHVVQESRPRAPSDVPASGYGSEIPIPLTRRTFGVAALRRGGTQRPPPATATSALGEGYAFDTTGLRDVVEKAASPRFDSVYARPSAAPAVAPPIGSFIPGPPPLPGFAAATSYAAKLPFPEMGGILAALRNAGSRDEILELVLTGARMVALKVALFVVKKGGYLGWVGTPEFAERGALQSVLIPLEANSIFDRAVREDIYLGPIRYDDVHAPLLRVMKNPSRDVAAVPVRVSGKTAVIIVADELGDTMIGTRRLEELARAAGDAFARVVRIRAGHR